MGRVQNNKNNRVNLIKKSGKLFIVEPDKNDRQVFIRIEEFLTSPDVLDILENNIGSSGPSPTIQTLTGGNGATNISWDYSLGYNAKVTFSGVPGVRTLDTPTNVSNGDYGTLIIDNGGFAGMSLVVPASFKVVNGGAGAISISGTANAIDVISWVYDGTNFLVSFGLNFT